MHCIFGLFDVLGFTSFCENCDAHSAETVLKIMDDFEMEIPELLLRALGPDTPQEKLDILKGRLKWLTFSDTIFVAIPLELSGHPNAVKFNLIFFTVLAIYINRRMFEIGLPVRGAVHIGDVIVSKRCFAGKAVMEAHNLTGKCQVAATIISEETHKLLTTIFSEPKGSHFMYGDAIVECDVPTQIAQVKGSQLWSTSSAKMKTLCWLFLELGRIERFNVPSDFHAYVESKFTAHGKKLSDTKAAMKAFNTANLFQHWKTVQDSKSTIGQLRQLVVITNHPAQQG